MVIGTREDVEGFALAGVDGVVCSSRDDVEKAMAFVNSETLVMFSPSAAAVAHDRLADWQQHGPVFVVMPLP
jgi:vacuolar-type H+-ATPase subunit F/Vma7